MQLSESIAQPEPRLCSLAARRSCQPSELSSVHPFQAQAQHLVKASTDAAQSAAGQPPRRNPTVGIRGPSSPETTPSAAVAVMPAEVRLENKPGRSLVTAPQFPPLLILRLGAI